MATDRQTPCLYMFVQDYVLKVEKQTTLFTANIEISTSLEQGYDIGIRRKKN